MKSLFASLVVVLSMIGFSAFASDILSLSEKHAAYAQSLFKDQWRDHLPQVSANWKRYVGGLDISKADNTQEFDGFFSFVTYTDPHFAPAFERAKRSLERAEGHFGAMAQEAVGRDRERFRHDLARGTAHTRELANAVLELQSRLLEAISIYEAPLKRIAYPLPRGGLYGRLQDQFANNVTGVIGQMGEGTLMGVELDHLNDVLRDLFDGATFGHIGKDGQKDFVSFVNFGGDSPRGWGVGSYGGDGATAGPYIRFLWY